MAALDRAGEKGGQHHVDGRRQGRCMASFFDALKEADALALDLDLDAEGLHLAVPPDGQGGHRRRPGDRRESDRGRCRPGQAPPGRRVLRLPQPGRPAAFDRLQGLSLRMLNPGGRATPELDRASALLRGLGLDRDDRGHPDRGRVSVRPETSSASPIPRSTGGRPGRCSWPWRGARGPLGRLPGRLDRGRRGGIPGPELQPRGSRRWTSTSWRSPSVKDPGDRRGHEVDDRRRVAELLAGRPTGSG